MPVSPNKNNVLQDRFGGVIFFEKNVQETWADFGKGKNSSCSGAQFFLKMDAEIRSNGSDVYTKSKNEVNMGRHLGIDF